MNHPSIFQVGRVDDDGQTVVIHGWGVGLCAAACGCHRHPDTQRLDIAADAAHGTLGLVSYRIGCTCCQPWTAPELAAMVRDLAEIETIPVTPAA